MAELELTRSPSDRRTYVLEGVGSLRLEGWASRRATAEAGGRGWELARHGFWQRGMEATDAAGRPAGSFDPRALRRGGTLRWGSLEYMLRPASAWRQRYALVDGEREIVLLDGKSWGRRPVKITIDDPAAIDAGLLLFSSFVVRNLASDADSAASGAASGAAVTGG